MIKVSVKNTDNKSVSRTVAMLLSIATQLSIIENPFIPAKKVPIVKTSKKNKGWIGSEFIINNFVSYEAIEPISRYKRNKPMQIKEKIKDHRLMLCCIAFSYVIKIFTFDFTGKLKKKIAIIN